ncbi:hypothetical protein [Streptomyces hygroscopicus]|uniref:hypothetical protein n=1 Tax=Streptomyces hygroscopicus TaxID=1912 RepID=UPI0037B6D162
MIWGETLSGHLFVGSNFGYFGWLARDLGVKRVYEIKDVPQTPFSGKTFIAPIVARIAATDEEELTRHPYDVHDIHDVDIPAGSVVHVDNFGNAKLKVDVGALRNRDVVTLSVNGKPVCEGDVVIAAVEGKQGDGTGIDISALRDYARPAEVVWVAAMPTLPNGKTDVLALEAAVRASLTSGA